MSDYNEPTGHACPSCGQIYARENIIEANAAEIEECNRIISAVCKENGRLLSANVALQAVVDYVRTIDHLQANEYLHELIADLDTNEL